MTLTASSVNFPARIVLNWRTSLKMAATHSAAFMVGPGQPLLNKTTITHPPRSGEIIIQVAALALQPLDSKILLAGYGPGSQLNYPAVLGTSGAGLVHEVGDNVKHFSKGDRVVFDTSAYVHTKDNLRTGTWQQFVACDARTVAKIGETSFEQAVLVNFPLQTAVAALHVFLGMGKPGTAQAEEKVLIWGAGGAVGTYAVQFSKQVGHTVVATASPRDFERQKRLGVAEVIDYKSPEAVEKLRKLGPYKYIITASGDAISQKALAEIMGPNGGKIASVLPGASDLPPNIEVVYSAFSQAAQKDDFGEWRDWWYQTYLPQVLIEDLMEPVKFTKVEGGLSSLQQASQDVFEGRIRGKIVLDPRE